ncbi:MAG: hypothetical protein ACHQAX_08270 [Gammaproteobacteria bacterium]
MPKLSQLINNPKLQWIKDNLTRLSNAPQGLDQINDRLQDLDENEFQALSQFFSQSFLFSPPYDSLYRIITTCIKPQPTETELDEMLRFCILKANLPVEGHIDWIEMFFERYDSPTYADDANKQQLLKKVLSLSKASRLTLYTLLKKSREEGKISQKSIAFFNEISEKELRMISDSDIMRRCNACADAQALMTLIQEIIADMPLADETERFLNDFKSNPDPAFIEEIINYPVFKDYNRLKHKKSGELLDRILELVVAGEYCDELNLDEYKDKFNTLLGLAIKYNRASLVERLCSKNAFISEDNLSVCYLTENLDIFHVLIQSTNDIEANNFIRRVVLDIAYPQNASGKSQLAHENMLILILEARKNIDLGLLLFNVIGNGSPKLAQLMSIMCKYGALQQIDHSQGSLVQCAINHDSLEVVPLLIASGLLFDENVADHYDLKNKGAWKHDPVKAKEHDEELPLIRKSLCEALHKLAESKDASVDLRKMVKEIFAAKKAQEAETQHTQCTHYTFLTDYNTRIQWGKSQQPISWVRGQHDESKLSELIKGCIGQEVELIEKTGPESHGFMKHSGELRYYGNGQSGLVGVGDYRFGIFQRNISEIHLVKLNSQSKVSGGSDKDHKNHGKQGCTHQ